MKYASSAMLGQQAGSTAAQVQSAPRQARAWLPRYGAAVLAVAAALGVSLANERWLAPQFSPLFFAAVLAAATLDYPFIPPLHSFGSFSVRDAVGLAVFAGVAVVTSYLSDSLRAQRARAEERAREVERLSAELEARGALRLEEKGR